MTSSSSTPPQNPLDDARPAGGTARSGGTRTPRRVQWANSDDIRVSIDPETSPRVSMHALDEMGLDPNAFETLKDALERHQSMRRPEKGSEGDREREAEDAPSTLPAPPPLAVVPMRATASAPPTQQNPFSTHQAAGVVRAHTRRGFSWLHRSPGGKGKGTSKGARRGGREKDAGEKEDNSNEKEGKGKGKDRDTKRGHRLHRRIASDTENDTDWTDNDLTLGPRPARARKGVPSNWFMPMMHRGTGMLPHADHHDPENHPHGAANPRLGTGVLSALLALYAGTLSGAAAPKQATLAPNLKKPGFGLVRYSMEDGPTLGHQETTTPRPPAPRAPRRTRSTDFDFTSAVGGRSNHAPFRPPGDLTDAGVVTTPGGRKRWSGMLKDLPLPIPLHGGHFKGFSLSLPGTPKEKGSGTPSRKEREREREKEKRRKRKKAEVYITRHVAAILQRQEFILKLARAMMMFGGPSHRLAAQIQSTGRVLDLELSCMYLPDVMLISFEDSATGTSNVKFIRQGSALDLEKLGEAHSLYWSVIHDTISVSEASASLDILMRKKPLYNFTQLILIGGMCSASICSVSFSGSFIDCLASAPLGALLVAIQLLSVRNELYGNVFEITIATLLSFISAALASTKHFCYSAVASSSVVLILPGFIVLCGSLELSSRSLVAGAVRLCFALMYSLFLGFGLAIGAEMYQKLLGRSIIGPTDYTCVDSHDPMGPWWQQTPSLWWAFLTVPMYSLFLSMRLMAPWRQKEIILLIAISCIGWVTNHFVGTKFPNQSDISAAVGAFAVGFVSNLYGRFFNGSAFVVMITGILFQVPSGLGNGGLLNFVSDQTSGSSSSYLSGFQTALQLISVAIGLTVGLGISLVVVHPVQSRRRAGGLFSL
ncbi:hypothetical protein HYDPIDRAFT_94568 [Hydnomerulius pinastri MD-312]|uniref:Unplaced genomic scaffold scaffold_21, whole genome shotgun sequence n=1 Tax=Hydnomerulius pinastri MD-312 TaxID=994086 RepID=A0A0C9W6A7_9AGAM|nr:hypothetical protein HYDPIDRAFT_94568 [Hydnomerulius pinastri MD-312]